MNYDTILKKVNPTYFSAKGCLGLLAETGDSDMVNFYNALDKEILTAFDHEPVNKSRIISLEVRHIVWKVLAEETDCQTIVDLPCGYLPHSLTAVKFKKNYYGLDLPIVTNEVSKIAAQHLSDAEKSFVQYHGVDATNYDSMRKALNDVKGKIFIMTDGLLGYFNRADLKVVFANIHQLLSEFGGCWYISDSHFEELIATTYAELTGRNMNEIMQADSSGSREISEIADDKRSFTEWKFEERRNFVESHGFTIKKFYFADKVKFIPSLKDNPALMQRILSAYQGLEGWILTAEATDATDNQKFVPFAQEFSLKDETLSISISGRLDTITAPKLLQKYEEERTKYTFKKIHINAAELEFISYAGLRVLNILRDSLEDKSFFKIDNADGKVENILKENGF